MSKGENFIHLKFEHEEAINSKRDLLTSEIDLLNITKSFGEFMALRALELKAKAKLFREMKKLVTEINRLEKALPEFEIPRIIKTPTKRKEAGQEKAKGISIGKNEGIESQLQEIQRKLRELSG